MWSQPLKSWVLSARAGHSPSPHGLSLSLSPLVPQLIGMCLVAMQRGACQLRLWPCLGNSAIEANLTTLAHRISSAIITLPTLLLNYYLNQVEIDVVVLSWVSWSKNAPVFIAGEIKLASVFSNHHWDHFPLSLSGVILRKKSVQNIEFVIPLHIHVMRHLQLMSSTCEAMSHYSRAFNFILLHRTDLIHPS